MGFSTASESSLGCDTPVHSLQEYTQERTSEAASFAEADARRFDRKVWDSSRMASVQAPTVMVSVRSSGKLAEAEAEALGQEEVFAAVAPPEPAAAISLDEDLANAKVLHNQHGHVDFKEDASAAKTAGVQFGVY